MIQDDVTGLVIDRTVPALRAALARLTDDALRARLAAAVRPALLGPWVDDVGRGWVTFFTEILGESR
jgi:hypothetical protein